MYKVCQKKIYISRKSWCLARLTIFPLKIKRDCLNYLNSIIVILLNEWVYKWPHPPSLHSVWFCVDRITLWCCWVLMRRTPVYRSSWRTQSGPTVWYTWGAQRSRTPTFSGAGNVKVIRAKTDKIQGCM